MPDDGQRPNNFDVEACFFHPFSAYGLFWSFTDFNTASRKLPESSPDIIVLTPLDKDPAFVQQNAAGHIYLNRTRPASRNRPLLGNVSLACQTP